MPYTITAVGDGFIGKTSMLLRYAEDVVPGEYVSTMFNNYYGTIIVDDEEYDMILADTSSQEEYDRIREVIYSTIDCFVICFCVNSEASLENVKQIWYPKIKKTDKNVGVILVGTKSDLRHDDPHACISENLIKKVKKDIKAYAYVECSSITRHGIDEVFQEAIRAIISQPKGESCTLL